MSDIEKIIPTPTVVTIKGEDLTISTMKVKQLSAVIKAASPFMPLFTGKSAGLDVPGLLVNHMDSAIQMVVVLTGKDTSWVEELDLDDMVLLFTALVEVNLDFFTRKVLPVLSEALSRLVVGRKSPEQVSGQ